MRRLSHIDLFSGAGGFCTGFNAAGWSTELAIEKVDSCVDTYQANHPTVPLIHGDIRNVSNTSIISAMGRKRIDLVTAGMPCETFSTAGSSSRSFYDHRQLLFQEAIRLASAVKARLILLENVPAITTKRLVDKAGKLVIDQIFDDLSAAGYKYFIDTVLNASDFGIPQRRDRFFILASAEKLPLQAPISKRNGTLSVGDAFTGLPSIEANDPRTPSAYTGEDTKYTSQLKDVEFWNIQGDPKRLTYHIAPNHRPATLERFALISQGEGLRDLFNKFSGSERAELQRRRVLPKKWYIQRNRRLKLAEPSVTVTSHCIDELVHPTLDRSLTIREVARLQSFPDAYDFKGGPIICPHIYETQDKYEQVGDAVPPLLAYQWACTIRDILA